MKKLVNGLEFIVRLSAAVILMEITANAYIWISTGFTWSWTWTEYKDMIIGYPLILGAAWLAFHAEEMADKVMKVFHRNKKPNLIVVKGEIEKS